MVQWVIKLCQFDIEYHPRTAIKVQALKDFIAKFTIPDEDNLPDETEKWTIKACWPKLAQEQNIEYHPRIAIQTDGLLAQERGEVGVVIITSDGETLKYGVQLKFPTTNNEVEYERILMGLRVGKALGAKNLLF